MKTTYEDTKETVSDRIERGFFPNGLDGAGKKTTQAIETQMGKLPLVSWLGLSVASMAASAVIISTRKKEDRGYANFVGLWAPCFMLLGVYNKLVQIEKSMAMQHAGIKPPAEVPNSTSYLS